MGFMPTMTDDPLAGIEQATEATRAEVAELRADVRDGFGHIIECQKEANRHLREISETLKAINERESWKRGDPPSGPRY